MFKILKDDSYKLVAWKGWDNVDLMKYDSGNEYMGMLTALYKKHLNKDLN